MKIRIPALVINLLILVFVVLGLYVFDPAKQLLGIAVRTQLIVLTIVMVVLEFVLYMIPGTRSYRFRKGLFEDLGLGITEWQDSLGAVPSFFLEVLKPIVYLILLAGISIGVGYLLTKFLFHQDIINSLFYFPLISSLFNLLFRIREFKLDM